MSKILFELDYRPNGDTVDDFAQKYMKEIPRIYEILTSIQGNQVFNPNDVAAGQLKVENGNLYIRNSDNNDWTLLGSSDKTYLGLGDSGFLLDTDLNVLIPKIDDKTGLISVGTTGNAGKIAGKTITTTDVQDGEVLVYRASINGFTNETKNATGQGKSLIFVLNGVNIVDYNGSSTQSVNLPSVVTSAEAPLKQPRNSMWIKPIGE